MFRASILLAAFLSLSATLHASRAETAVADRVLVLKSKRVMMLMAGDRILHSYLISLGQQPVGPKRVQGDKKTPEGRYFIDGRNPHSRFHLSLHLSYPNAADLRRAQEVGLSPGGNIAIHGMPQEDGTWNPALVYADWTNGCIAVTNREIEEIWQLVADGTPVDIER